MRHGRINLGSLSVVHIELLVYHVNVAGLRLLRLLRQKKGFICSVYLLESTVICLKVVVTWSNNLNLFGRIL